MDLNFGHSTSSYSSGPAAAIMAGMTFREGGVRCDTLPVYQLIGPGRFLITKAKSVIKTISQSHRAHFDVSWSNNRASVRAKRLPVIINRSAPRNYLEFAFVLGAEVDDLRMCQGNGQSVPAGHDVNKATQLS